MGTVPLLAPAQRGESAVTFFEWPRRRSTAAALIALLFVQTVLFFFVTHRSFFFGEDFINFQLAQDRFFLRYLLTPILGVYPAPGERLVIYVFHKLLPMNFWATQVFLIVVLMGTTILLWQLVRTFARCDRWWTVALLVPFALSLTLVVPLGWWAAGAPILPGLLFTVVALSAWLRSYTDPKPRLWVAVSVIAVAAAGAFSIKFLLIPTYLLFLRLVIYPRLLGLPGGIRQVWEERMRWIALAVPPAAYLAVFVLSGIASRSGAGGSRPYLEYGATAWFRAVIPVAFLNARLGESGPSVSSWVIVVCSQVVFWGLVAATWRRSRLALRAWALFTFVVVVNLAMVGPVRLPTLGVKIAYELRYYPEILLFLPLALALALRQGEERRPESAWERTSVGQAALGVAASLYVVSFLIWAPPIVDGELGEPTRIWYENLIHDVQTVTVGASAPVIVDSETPWYVMTDWMAPHNRVSTILRLANVDATYNRYSQETYLVQLDGRLAEAAFLPVSVLMSGTTSATGVRIVGGGSEGPLGVCLGEGGRIVYRPNADIIGDRLTLRVAYSQASRGPVAVEVDAHDPIRPFRYLVLRPMQSGVELVDLATSRLRALTLETSPSDRVCIERIEIGSLRALGG